MIVGHDKAGNRAKQSDRLDGRDLLACASEDGEEAEHGVSLLRPSVLRMFPFFCVKGAKELRIRIPWDFSEAAFRRTSFGKSNTVFDGASLAAGGISVCVCGAKWIMYTVAQTSAADCSKITGNGRTSLDNNCTFSACVLSRKPLTNVSSCSKMP